MTQHKKELDQIKAAAGYFLPKGGIIAGGAITSVFTGQPIADVDIYFKSSKDFIEAVGQAYDESFWCVAATDRAVTFAHRDCIVQLMHFDWFATAEEVFDAFDFTTCMGAYDVDKEEFIFHEYFFKHSSQRYLNFHAGTRYPLNSLLRVLKYQSKGYKIGRSDMLRIGLRLSTLDLQSWDDLADAIGGQYGERVKLETDKPFSLDTAIEILAEELIVQAKSEEMPGTAYKLLEKIGADISHLDEDDIKWLKGRDGWYL